MDTSKTDSSLKDFSIKELFKELRKKQGVTCIVIEDKYIIEINKSEVD